MRAILLSYIFHCLPLHLSIHSPVSSSTTTIMNCLLLVISLFAVAVAASHESLPAEVYWKKALPETPIPGAIRDIINHVDAKGKGGQDKDYVINMFEKDMLPGTKLTMQFLRTTKGRATFIPKQSADSIPFSSSKLPEILAHFSLDPKSDKAKFVKETLHDCDAPPSHGETKLCTTSLEAMVEFATSTLGTSKVLAMSTTVTKENTPNQEYAITGIKRLSSSSFMPCHARNYEYAVYYCHSFQGISAYEVSMVGKDTTEVKAVATCHKVKPGPYLESYTKGLKLMPGTTPTLCHLLPQDHILFAPNK